MKKYIVILSLLVCVNTAIIASDYVSTHTPSDREDVNKSCTPSCHKPEKKRTCVPTPISHATTIKHSGCYCLTRDIRGTIVIAADDVMLDLNCHEIDADGSANAVSANGYTGVTIKNGSIINSSAAGINIIACEEVVVADITFRNNADLSLSIQAELVGPCPTFTVTNPSQGIWVSNLDISQGNRAMLFRGCNELRVESCDVYENTNTIANAVVGMEHCNDVLFEEVFVNNNVKAVPGQGQGPLGGFGQETAVFLIQATNNVQVRNCMTNNNSAPLGGATIRPITGLYITGLDFDFTGGFCLNPNFLSSGVIIEGHQSNSNTNTTGSLNGIRITLTANPIIRDSQTNGNLTTNAQSGTIFGSQDFLAGLLTFACPATFIKNHQANQNISRGSEMFGIAVATGFTALVGENGFANGSIIEDCQCNQNGDLVDTVATFGINLSFGVPPIPSSGIVVRRCQTNGNKAHALVGGMLINWNDALIEDCQADDNISTGSGFSTDNLASGGTSGFVVSSGTANCRFISCNASNNTCTNDMAAGINVTNFPPLVPGNQPVVLTLAPLNVVVQDCVTNNNISTNDLGYGIRLNEVTASEVVDCTAIANQVGFFNNAGVPQNSFWGNRAENNSTADYQNIPTGNIVDFFKSSATFVPTPPNRWSNLAILP